jgi:hypothetical protein
MKNIKKFENFEFSEIKPEEISESTCYYSCDECDNIWKSDVESDCCKFCDSDEVEELHEEEWNELSKNQ